VFLLDTPGFDDTNRSDTDVLKTVSGYLAMMYSKNIKLSGIIYLHRITDVRFSGSTAKNLSVFKKLCGNDFYPNVILATTMWENLGDPGLASAIGDRREKELLENDGWWGLMIRRGSKTFRHSDDKGSAFKIVDYLISLRSRAVLEIQAQLVDENKNLQDTSAGMEVEREIQQIRVKHSKQLKEIEEETQQALQEKDKDLELIELLHKEAEKKNEEMMKAYQNQQALQISNQELLEETMAKYGQQMELLQQQLQQRDRDHVNMERRFDDERRANEARHRQRDEQFARERDDAQKQNREALESERRRNEHAQRQHDERVASERSRTEQAQMEQHSAIVAAQLASFAAERAKYEADVQRSDAGMADQTQRFESAISGLQQRLDNLSPPRTISNPSLPGTLSDSDGPAEDEAEDETFRDHVEDYMLERAISARQHASNKNSLANGGPLLMAVTGMAEYGPDGLNIRLRPTYGTP